MHEISLVRSIFNTLESEFPKAELEFLMKIDLKVGELSNVEPILMQNAFEAVTVAEEKFQNVELNVIKMPTEIYCNTCNLRSRISNYKFVCSQCGEPNNNLVQGTELLIHQVHFRE